MNLLLVIAGLILLLFGGDWLVRSGVSLAARFQISPLIIGLTIVSMGTSAPELMVSVQAALDGYPDMAMGNVVGSNIANISLVLGLTALILSIPVSRETVRFSWPVMFFSTLLLFVFATNHIISRIEGLIMLTALVAFIYLLYRRSRKHVVQKDDKPKVFSLFASLAILTGSIAALMFGANLLVKGAVGLATALGVSERIISITVVAFGTSVPELATSLVAAFRKQLDISVGNLIGSNIFNILCILGLTATIKPMKVSEQMFAIDLPVVLGITLLLGLFFIPLKKPVIKTWKGIVLISTYFAYYYVVFS